MQRKSPDIAPGRDRCSDTTPVQSRLLRILGAGFGLAVILGATVGGEILRLPGSVAALLPSPSLFFLAWVLEQVDLALPGEVNAAGVPFVPTHHALVRGIGGNTVLRPAAACGHNPAADRG